MAQSINIRLDLGQCLTDAVTEIWKWGQVNKDDANYQRIYHMQYDKDSNTDKALLKAYVKQRAERIADFISEYLAFIVFGNGILTPINNPEPSPFLPPQRDTEPNYVEYDMILPAGWNANTYHTLEQHMNDYVVNGATADWLTNIGEKQGGVFEQKATGASTNIIRNIYHKNSTI